MPISTFALALVAAIALPASASVQTNEGRGRMMPPTPRLRLAQLSGELEIGSERAEDIPGGKLPLIASGSIVRVLSGTAVFESDYHATIQARKGNAFLFTAVPPYGDHPTSFRIGAVADEPSPLDVRIGGLKFMMGSDAALKVASAGRGELAVEVGGGYVELVSGNPVRQGASIVFSTYTQKGPGLDPGDTAIIQVPPETAFLRPGVKPQSLKITVENASTIRIKSVRPAGSAVAKRESRAQKLIAGWPAASKAVARLMLEKYGAPNSVGSDRIEWDSNAPWRKTIVYRVGKPSNFPPGHLNVLQQSVRYQVSPEARRAINELEMGVSADDRERMLSAASDSEDLNFLALNLADEVVTGTKTPQEARAFYVKTIGLSMEGKASPYMDGLLFEHY